MRRFAALALLALAACAHEPDPASAPRGETAPTRSGQRLAETYCARCHAIGADGESAHYAAPPFRTLNQRYPVEMLDEAFAEGVLVGHPDMPSFRFEPDQIDALLAYIKSVQSRPAA